VTLTGRIGFADAQPKDKRELKWLIVLESENPSPPTIEMRRTVLFKNQGRTLEEKRAYAKIRLVETNTPGASVDVDEARAELTLTGRPKLRAGRNVWEVDFFTPPASFTVRFELRGKQGSEGLTLLVNHPANEKVGVALGSDGRVVRTFAVGTFPRLCVGLQQATPPTPPPSYRGLTPGSGDPDEVRDKRPGALGALLYRVFVLLDSPGTLDPVWDQQSGTATATELSGAKFKAEPVRVAEELWARQVTEMLSFARYGIPSARYGGGTTDADFDSKNVIPGTSNPCYGLSAACQTLATFGVATRLNLEGGNPLVIASGAHGAGNAVRAGAQWFNSDDPANPVAVTPSGGNPDILGQGPSSVNITAALDVTKVNSPRYGPGAVHLFSNRPTFGRLNDSAQRAEYQALNDAFAQGRPFAGTRSVLIDTQDDRGNRVIKELRTSVISPTERRHASFLVRNDGRLLRDNQDDPHVGFTLRIRRHPSDPSKHRIQLLDTGGFGVDGRGTGLGFGGGFHSGIFDGPAADTLANGKNPYRGFGVFPEMTPDTAADVEKNVQDVLRNARPLGFARLALIDRAAKASAGSNITEQFKAGAYLYVSPLLTMYLNDAASPTSNYAIARYVWSLRNLPGAGEVEAHWYIYHPLYGLARAMLNASRAQGAVALAQAASGQPPAKTLFENTIPIGELISQSDGTVEMNGAIARKKTSVFHNFIERNNLPMDQAHFGQNMPTSDRLPPYFVV
jgi:hypothetical protein